MCPTIFEKRKKRDPPLSLSTSDRSGKDANFLLRKDEKKHGSMVDARKYSERIISVHGNRLFDLMPDEVIVERRRVIVSRRYFPFGTTTFTILVDKIGLFEVTHSLFFSSLHIQGGETGSNIDTTVRWLSHVDAQRTKILLTDFG